MDTGQFCLASSAMARNFDSSIPGITAGRELIVSGRVSFVDGERRVYNPLYELVPA